MKLGLVQYNPVWESPTENILKIEKLLETSSSETNVLIFPEMTLTGFTMNAKNFAEDIDGLSTKYFIDLARKLKQHVFAGIIEKDGNKFYNSLFHFDGNGIITARYRKIHPYSKAGENIYYNGADEMVISKIDKVKVGLGICYDLRFPELFRHYGKQRAEMIFLIANWPISRIEHWKTLLRARAIENQCFVAGVNRVGNDPENKYNGCSAIFDPMGNQIVLADDEEKIIEAEMNLEMVRDVRAKLPFLDDIKLI